MHLDRRVRAGAVLSIVAGLILASTSASAAPAATTSQATGTRTGGVALAIGSSELPAVLPSGLVPVAAPARPHVTSQPRSTAVTVGRRAAFAVGVTGTGAVFQWQQRMPGRAWSSVPGGTGSRLTVTATRAHDGREYRVVVSDAGGRVGSRVATLWVVTCVGAASAKPALTGCPDPALANRLTPSPATAAKDYGGRSSCWTRNDSSALRSCHFPSSGPRRGVPHVALVGDSHARQYLPALIWLAKEGKITLDTYLKGTCSWSTLPSVKGTVGSSSQRTFTRLCQEWRGKLTARLTRDPGEYDAVITTSWAGAAALYPRGVDTTTEKRAARRDGALAAWRPVLRTGTPVFAIRDNPNPGTSLQTCLTRHRSDTSRCDVRRSVALRTWDPLPAAVARTSGKAHLVDLTGRFCTSTRCPAVIGGVNVYRDQSHVTVTYTTTLAPWIWRQVGPYL